MADGERSVWQGERVRLRAVREADWETFEAWSQDDELGRSGSWIPFPQTPEATQRWTEGTVAAGPDVFGEISVEDLLPTEDDIPAGLVTTDEARLTAIDEVVAGFSDPGDAAAQLETWGWVENASHTFELAEGAEPPTNKPTFLVIGAVVKTPDLIQFRHPQPVRFGNDQK